MKYKAAVLIGVFFALIFMLSPLFATIYDVDTEHTNINFDIDHLVISTVKGRFDKFSGSFEIDDKTGNLVKIEGVIDAASINTNDADRDKHLRSDEFFDVKKFKELKFVSKPFSIKKGKTGKVKGKLTIHGVTRDVTWKVTYKGTVKGPWGTEKAAAKAVINIKRKDFGLKWNKALELGGVMVGDEVRIELNLQGNKREIEEKDSK